MSKTKYSNVDWFVEFERLLEFVLRRALPFGVIMTTFGAIYLFLAYGVLGWWSYVEHTELPRATELGENLLFKARSMWEYPMLGFSVFCLIVGVGLLWWYFRIGRNLYAT